MALPRIPKWVGTAVRVLVSGGILYYLSKKIDWAGLAAKVAGAHPGWLLLAFLLIGLVILVTAWRWRILLRVQGIDLRRRHVLELSMIGQFFNTFLLGTTGGDVAKIFYVAQAAPTKKSAAGFSVLADRIVGLVALVGLTAALALGHHAFFHPPLGDPQAAYHARKMLYLFYLMAAAIGGVLVAAWMLPRFLRFTNFSRWEKRLPLHEKIENVSEALRKNLQSPRANVETLAISLVSHVVNLFAQYAIIVALGIDVPLPIAFTVTGLVYVLIAIPISFGGIGFREYLFILFLGLAGANATSAAAASLLGYAFSILWGLLGGFVYLRYRKPDHHPAAFSGEEGAAS
ncbi:MAG TPA: lysylphosphatidylglycerol synthase transmembrane domain-containing protein [Candidatus Methylacidiphilales bacterium]